MILEPDLNFPKLESSLQDSRMISFDYMAWMNEVEAARQSWVASYRNRQQLQAPHPNCERFFLE
jgi:hypothetical protein